MQAEYVTGLIILFSFNHPANLPVAWSLALRVHFTLRWRSALVGQEFSCKTWLFEARDGMLEKMKRQ